MSTINGTTSSLLLPTSAINYSIVWGNNNNNIPPFLHKIGAVQILCDNKGWGEGRNKKLLLSLNVSFPILTKSNEFKGKYYFVNLYQIRSCYHKCR